MENRTESLTSLDQVIGAVIYSVTGLGGLLLSLTIIWIILKTKKLRTRPNFLLLDLLISDILLIFIQTPYGVFYTTYRPPPARTQSLDIYCIGLIYNCYALSVTSIVTLTLISFDRCLAVVSPFLYRRKMNKCYVVSVLAWPWFHAYVCLSPVVFTKGWTGYEGRPRAFCGFSWERASKTFIICILVFSLFLPVVFLFVTSIFAHTIAHRHYSRMVYFATRKVLGVIAEKNENSEHHVSSPAPSSSKAFNQESRMLVDDTAGLVDNVCRSGPCKKRWDQDSKITNNTRHIFQQPPKTYFFVTCMATHKRNRVHPAQEQNITVSNTSSENILSQNQTPVSKTKVTDDETFEPKEWIPNVKRQIKIIVSNYILLITYLACWMAFIIPRLLSMYGYFPSDRLVLYTHACTTFVGFLNPILILLTRREIRLALIKHMRMPGDK